MPEARTCSKHHETPMENNLSPQQHVHGLKLSVTAEQQEHITHIADNRSGVQVKMSVILRKTMQGPTAHTHITKLKHDSLQKQRHFLVLGPYANDLCLFQSMMIV